MAIFGTLGYIAIAVVILFFMIAVHEFGHYIVGKLLGFKITEFALGMGKILYKRTNKKTGEIFTVRAIPLGGFCSFYGDDGLESKTVGQDSKKKKKKYESGNTDSTKKDSETAAADSSRKEIGFNDQPEWKRLLVLFAGGFFNFISAVLFSIVLLLIVGYNQFVAFQGIEQTDNAAYLQEGDIIQAISVNGGRFQEFTLLDGFSSVLSKVSPDDTITFQIQHTNGTVEPVSGFKLVRIDSEGRLGIGITGVYTIKKPIGFFEILEKSVVFCFQVAWMILVFLWGLITGKISLSGVGGPIATVSVMTQSLSSSLLNIFLLVPLISVNLGLFNLLPFPALDGARMVFVGLEWVRGKPVNPQLEGRIHMIGIIVLFGLVFLADFNYLMNGLVFLRNCCLRL